MISLYLCIFIYYVCILFDIFTQLISLLDYNSLFTFFGSRCFLLMDQIIKTPSYMPYEETNLFG